MPKTNKTFNKAILKWPINCWKNLNFRTIPLSEGLILRTAVYVFGVDVYFRHELPVMAYS
jgi:hypothetical protein